MCGLCNLCTFMACNCLPHTSIVGRQTSLVRPLKPHLLVVNTCILSSASSLNNLDWVGSSLRVWSVGVSNPHLLSAHPVTSYFRLKINVTCDFIKSGTIVFCNSTNLLIASNYSKFYTLNRCPSYCLAYVPSKFCFLNNKSVL